MDLNIEMLNYIFQNSKMGIEAFQLLLKKTDNPKILENIALQIEDYKELNKQASRMLAERGKQEEDLPVMEQVMSSLAINTKAFVDNSPCHLCEMILQGGVMGIIDIIKNLKRYDRADRDILSLGKRLLKLEEDGQERWKNLLREFA